MYVRIAAGLWGGARTVLSHMWRQRRRSLGRCSPNTGAVELIRRPLFDSIFWASYQIRTDDLLTIEHLCKSLLLHEAREQSESFAYGLQIFAAVSQTVATPPASLGWLYAIKGLEPAIRFELMTYGLQIRCSTNWAKLAPSLLRFVTWSNLYI